MQDNTRVIALDGVRGIALLVVLVHTFDLLDADSSSLLIGLFEHLLDIGWVGVQLFFVLSGFLITGILLDSKSSPGYYRNFFARRILRIFPLYYATLLAVLVVLPALHLLPRDPTASNQVWLWIYLGNWVESYGLGVRTFSHFWSLAVEEQFYLVWPFVVYRLTRQRLLTCSLLLVVASLLIRIAMVATAANAEAIYMFTVTRMDALASGAVVACVIRSPALLAWFTANVKLVVRLTWAALIFGALASHGFHRTGAVEQTLGYLTLSVVFAVFVLVNATGTASTLTRRLLESSPLVSVGRYSYGMYVFGMLLHRLCGPQVKSYVDAMVAGPIPRALGYIVAMLTITYVVAFACFHLFEQRFLALKRFFVPPRPPRSPELVGLERG